MLHPKILILTIMFSVMISGGVSAREAAQDTGERRYLLEQVGDAAVVQLYADGFESLSLREKILIWHLYGAALAGRTRETR